MNRQPLLYTLISIMVCFWAGNFIVSKFALRDFPPLLLSGMRAELAAVLILPAYWWERRRKPAKWDRGDLPLLIGIGVLGIALNQVFFVFGISRTSVAHSAIIIGLTPILVLLLAALRGQESITARKLIGMCIALSGIAVLKLFEVRPVTGAGPTWTGDLAMLAAALTFALFTVWGKPATVHHSPLTVNTIAYVGAAVALAPITIWQAARLGLGQVTIVGWTSLLYMALCSSVICYLIYYYALSHMTASRVSAFAYFQPLLATTMGVLVLGERVTAPLGIAAVIVFAGVYLTERG